MKKPLYKDKFVSITNSDIELWAIDADSPWELGISKSTKKYLANIIKKHKLDDDEQYNIAHYNQVLYLCDVIHGLCNIIQDERKVVSDFKNEFEILVRQIKKL